MFFVDSLMICENYFSGIAYSRDSIVLSTDGLEKYCSDSNNIMDLQGGRYSLMHTDTLKKETHIMTDPTGQDIIFYYQENEYWAVSNSLLFLVEKLQEKNKKLTIYFPGLWSFQIRHSLGEQPLSNNTLIEGIKILPRDHYIFIQNGHFGIDKRNYTLTKIIDITTYVDELTRTIWDQISVINDLTALIPQENIRCDLSGGMDSRLVFGMVHKSKAAKNIKYSSNKKLSSDYLIASSLLAHYGFGSDNSSINSQGSTLDAAQQLYLYKYGNAGIYTKVYQATYNTVPRSLHIHGAGGESLRGQYVGSPRQIIGRLKSQFGDDSQYDLVKKEFFGYFNENNLNIDDSRSMLHHSRSFRARFHFGRNWYRFFTNPLFTPLCDIRFESLADFLQKKYHNSFHIFYDSYMLLDKILVCFPFDENEKNLDVNKLSSLHILFSSLSKRHDVEARRIYGEIGGDCLLELSRNHSSKDYSFNEFLQKEKKDFFIKYPRISLQFDWPPNIYTLLNSLELN